MKNINIIDLNVSQDDYLEKECEVCIVGAGAAGIYLATELAKKGIETVLLEAGGENTANANIAGFDAKTEGEIYLGASKGRYFGLGGTTSHWGGVLIPHAKHDIQGSGDTLETWKHVVNIVETNCNEVLKKLGWQKESGFFNSRKIQSNKYKKLFNTKGISLLSDLHLPFRKKNLTFLLKTIPKNNKLQIFLNSVVYELDSFKSLDSETIRSVKAKSVNGRKLQISAKKIILSVGAIESARMLLELNKNSNRSIIKDTAAIGQYLADHISIPIAKVDLSAKNEVIKAFSPYFSKGWIRSFRFIDNLYDEELPRNFFHFVYKNESKAFLIVKELLTALQGKRKPTITIKTLISGILGITKLGFYKYAFSLLYVPKNTEIFLQLDVEQSPNRENVIKLGNELDKFGRQVVEINWRISRKDLQNIEIIKNQFLKKLYEFKEINLNVLDYDESILKCSDAYHPVGTCRMGNEKESVVDTNLKVYGVDNLWVVSTGVLPSAGSANPTFTMLCLANSLVENISKMK